VVFKYAKSEEVLRNSTENVENDTIFSGEEIAWFNKTTGEIKFNTNRPDRPNLIDPTIIRTIYIYLNNEYLFSLKTSTPIMSYVIDSPVLSATQEGCYIKSGYPDWDLETFDKNDPTRISREKNWKALVESEGWKLFIKQLKKEGRYRE
jgi:hypothetical protein